MLNCCYFGAPVAYHEFLYQPTLNRIDKNALIAVRCTIRHVYEFPVFSLTRNVTAKTENAANFFKQRAQHKELLYRSVFL